MTWRVETKSFPNRLGRFLMCSSQAEKPRSSPVFHPQVTLGRSLSKQNKKARFLIPSTANPPPSARRKHHQLPGLLCEFWFGVLETWRTRWQSKRVSARGLGREKGGRVSCRFCSCFVLFLFSPLSFFFFLCFLSLVIFLFYILRLRFFIPVSLFHAFFPVSSYFVIASDEEENEKEQQSRSRPLDYC